MQIAVITTPREASYVDETLRQIADGLAPETPIDVFSDDPERVPIFSRWAPTTWHFMPDDIWAVAKDRKRFERATLNFLCAVTSGEDDLVIFEDDVAVKPIWRSYLQGVIDRSGADLISMYWPDETPFVRGGRLNSVITHYDLGYAWHEYNTPVTFHGSLGLWMSAQARADLALYMKMALDALQERTEPGLGCRVSDLQLMPFDNTVAAFLRVLYPAYEMVATDPALVDHRGEISAIPENASHGPRKSPGY